MSIAFRALSNGTYGSSTYCLTDTLLLPKLLANLGLEYSKTGGKPSVSKSAWVISIAAALFSQSSAAKDEVELVGQLSTPLTSFGQ